MHKTLHLLLENSPGVENLAGGVGVKPPPPRRTSLGELRPPESGKSIIFAGSQKPKASRQK